MRRSLHLALFLLATGATFGSIPRGSYGPATNLISVGYDKIGQITSWSARELGDGLRLNEQFGFGYDQAGNLASRTNGSLVQTFANDSLNQISSIGRNSALTVSGATPAPATSVTVNGQPAQTYGDFTFARTNCALVDGTNTFTIIAQNAYGVRVTNSTICNLPSAIPLKWDSNGNLTNDGTRSFAYSPENQLTNITLAGQWKTDFIYDGLGRRRIERDYGWSGTWTKTNELHFIYNGWLLVQVRGANNSVLAGYTRGLDLSGSLAGVGGIGGLLARTDGNESTFCHSDGAGNVTALIDGSQTMAERLEYGPFGSILFQGGRMAGMDLMGFSSMFTHRPSGIVLYPWRPYFPNLQRWGGRDPIGIAGGINLYAFVRNSPVGMVDIDGLYPREAWEMGAASPSSPDPAGTALAVGVAQWLSDIAFGIAKSVASLWGPMDDNWEPLFGTMVGDLEDEFNASVFTPLTDGFTPAQGYIYSYTAPAMDLATFALLAGKAKCSTTAAAGRGVRVGQHAGKSIAARSASRDFTEAERAEINRIGSETGCHTCGTTTPGTKSGNFIPDHQPPSALNPTGVPQRLYPQCLECSREQGLKIAEQLRKVKSE